ncbi:MAG: delta-60 repeat domain-containing protein, partial [Flavobacteriales bacterium]|nr:delta-60 repeat domain-containing protein [Flavobacteriales bacterium]
MVSAFPLFAGLQGGDYHVFPDGRVLMSGAHTLNDPVRGFVGLYNLIWFTNTGYLDTTRVHRTSNGVIYNFKEQPDGRFLCSGTMTTYDGQPVGKVFRIDAAGALDPTFNAPLPWGQAYAYHTLADGRIMLGGYFKPEGTTDTLCTLRLMPDGTVDPSFHPVRGAATFATGSPVPYVLDIEPLADGRCVIVGRFDQLEGEVRGGIALLDEHGDLLEDAFTGEGCGLYIYQSPSIDIPYKAITGITPAPDGSYYIHGGYHGYDDG